MPTTSRRSSRGSSGRAGEGGRAGARNRPDGKRRVRAKSQTSVRYDIGGTRQGKGYALRGRNMSYSGRSGSSFWSRVFSLDARAIISLVVILVVLTALILGIITLVRGCVSREPEPEGTGNPVDPRVAAGVSAELTTDLAAQLDEGEKIVALATRADEIGDERLIKLALDEPSALDFVLTYPEAEHAGQPFGLAINKGEVPTLTCWDPRWGAVDYADGPLAVTGSGPCALSMAAMGLTGNTENTPAVIAGIALSDGYASGASGMQPGFITEAASKLGLEAHFYEPNSENLNGALSSTSFVLAEIKASTLAAGSRNDGVHWVLILPGEGEGMVRVLDPTSTVVSASSWSSSVVAAASNSLYSVSAAEAAATPSE